MQHVTKQHHVEGFIRRRKARAVIAPIIDRRFRATVEVDTSDTCAEQRAEMMRDKTIAAANVQNFRSIRDGTSDLQGHVIGAADFSSASFALEAALNSVSNGRKYSSAPPQSSRR